MILRICCLEKARAQEKSSPQRDVLSTVCVFRTQDLAHVVHLASTSASLVEVLLQLANQRLPERRLVIETKATQTLEGFELLWPRKSTVILVGPITPSMMQKSNHCKKHCTATRTFHSI